MAESGGAQVEQLVARLVGDNTSYIQMINASIAATSAAVKQLEGSAIQLAKRVTEPVVQQGKVVNDYSGEVKKLGKTFDDTAMMQRRFHSGMRDINDTAHSAGGIFARLGGMMSGQVQGLLAIATGGGLMAGLNKAISLSGASESVDITFKTIIGDADKAKATLSELRAFADWSPFNTQEVMEAGKMLLAMKVSADDLVPSMAMLGDVSGALAIPIQQLIYLYGTLKSQGRAYTIDIQQFASRGIPIWEEMSKVLFGVKDRVQDVRHAVEAGTVTFAQVQKAFINMTSEGGAFFNSMVNKAKSLQGLMASLQSEIDNVFKAVGDDLVENLDLKWLVGQITNVAKAAKQWFMEMDPGMKRLIIYAGTAVVLILGIAAAITLSGIALNTFFGGMGIILGVVVSIAMAFALWASSIGDLHVVWREIEIQAGRFYEWVKPLIPLIVTITALFAPWVTALAIIVTYWKEILDGGKKFWSWISPILNELRITLVELANQLKAVLIGVWDTTLSYVKKIFGGIVDLWETHFGKLSINWSTVQAGLMDFMIFVEYATSHMDKVWDVTLKAIKYATITAFKYIINNIFTVMAVIAFPALLIGMVTNWREMLTSMAVSTAIWGGQLLEFFKSTFESLVRGMANLLGPEKIVGLLTGGIKVEDLLKDAFTEMGANAADKFSKAMKVVRNLKITLTPAGIEIGALDKLQADAKKELDDAIGNIQMDSGKLKEQRKAREFFRSLADVGWRIFDASLKPANSALAMTGKKLGEELGTGVTQGLKKELKLDAALKDSLDAAIKIDEYKDMLLGNKGTWSRFDWNAPDNFKMGPMNVNPYQQAGPMGEAAQDRQQVVQLLTIIAGGIGALNGKPPPTIKTANLPGS